MKIKTEKPGVVFINKRSRAVEFSNCQKEKRTRTKKKKEKKNVCGLAKRQQITSTRHPIHHIHCFHAV